MSAAERYAQQVSRYLEQMSALSPSPASEPWGNATSYRFDPLRDPGPNFDVLASFIRPGDEVIEVGGGAGRIALPLALRCRHVTNVEPSAGMRKEFAALAQDARISNVTVVPDSWPAKSPLLGDVALTEDVTYFITGIVAFLESLTRAARRTAIVSIWEVPPPNRNPGLFELVHGMPQAMVPGREELLAVLSEMGIRPTVVELPEHFSWPEPSPRTRSEAVAFALAAVQGRESPGAAARVDDALDSLFTFENGRFVPNWRPPSPGLLINWATD